MPSPIKPWIPGKQPTYTSFRLVVNICQDGDGNVWSDHEFLTPEDEEVASGLFQGGVPQVAHSLLTEAVRREVFTSALVLLSRTPQYLAQWQQATSEGRKTLEGVLEAAAEKVLIKTVKKMIPGAVAGVLTMLSQQGGTRTPPAG
jgi:hypothetical protein